MMTSPDGQKPAQQPEAAEVIDYSPSLLMSAIEYKTWIPQASILSVLKWMLLAIFSALLFDILLMQFVWTKVTPHMIRYAHVFESVGHGLGVIAILIALFLAAPKLRWSIPRLAVLSLGCGLLANLVKLLLIQRSRPVGIMKQIQTDQITSLATFGEWFPLGEGGSALQSFPSSHAATAFGLAVGLSWLFPRAWAWFYTIAAMVCFQRVFTGYHFVSDVMAGAALAWCCSTWNLRNRWLNDWWEPFEYAMGRPRVEDESAFEEELVASDFHPCEEEWEELAPVSPLLPAAEEHLEEPTEEFRALSETEVPTNADHSTASTETSVYPNTSILIGVTSFIPLKEPPEALSSLRVYSEPESRKRAAG